MTIIDHVFNRHFHKQEARQRALLVAMADDIAQGRWTILNGPCDPRPVIMAAMPRMLNASLAESFDPNTSRHMLEVVLASVTLGYLPTRSSTMETIGDAVAADRRENGWIDLGRDFLAVAGDVAIRLGMAESARKDPVSTDDVLQPMTRP